MHAVLVNIFNSQELDTTCSNRNLALVYQPHYVLHTEIQHQTPVECYALDGEKEVLVMQLGNSERWIELPSGSIVGVFDPQGQTNLIMLHTYQPRLDTLNVPPLREPRP